MFGTADAWNTARLFGLALGALVYLTALGLGLGAVAWCCERIDAARGRALFVAVVLLPELVSPAFPELPTLVSFYARLLDLGLGLGLHS
jgi:hypothetical protein